MTKGIALVACEEDVNAEQERLSMQVVCKNRVVSLHPFWHVYCPSSIQ